MASASARLIQTAASKNADSIARCRGANGGCRATTRADDFTAVHTLECVTRSADRRPPLYARARARHSWPFDSRVVVCALKFSKTPSAAETPPSLNGSDDRHRALAHFARSLAFWLRISRSSIWLALSARLLLFLDGN